ncbi:hypothetical protein E0493_20385 [Roseomonas sp. M0104]|uniref:Ankyrin repeat domain-containing protein n=1 Tax=Teichococcus coralli TaxID=2545983 RepID=A0A845BKM6_9PROT|nr:hypothetical protein [Pseudoroseomonas coralli]MXP65712.1 hypothetical protein [Pseudoroseomonas coralli]
MRHLPSTPLSALLAGLLAAALPALPAAAQMLNGPMMPNTPAAPAAKEPPALPGLAGRAPAAPIPAEPGKNLGPNEALFDAINRGDLAAARDAMARGADLQAHNVLGLTPLESSVDQGRREITFFLLSTRPTVVTSVEPSTPLPRGAPPSAAARNMPLASPPPSALRGAAPPASGRREAISRPPSATAYANAGAADGGTPRPEKGFLGFDASRPGGGY